MTSFGYWADRVPTGFFLCMLCFEAFPLAAAWFDEAGQQWDICTACGEREAENRRSEGL